jgi:anthranilate phosphoribosyltransferase
MVVHGSGLDEVALHGETRAVRLAGGALEALTIAPEEVGFARLPLARIQGGGPEENAERLKALLYGYGAPAERQAVALNAGALLLTAGRAATLREGAEIALGILGTGSGHRLLQALVEISHA